MSFLFSRRDRVDVPPVRVPREGGRTRMAGERSVSDEIERRGRRGRRGRRDSVPPTGGRGPKKSSVFGSILKEIVDKAGGRNPDALTADQVLSGLGAAGDLGRGGRGGRGGRRGVKTDKPTGKKGPRPEGMPPKGPSKGTKYVTMRDPETGYKYGGRVVDGVPQFTKPDFSDRKPLPGYPKKGTDRPTGTGGKRSDPRREKVYHPIVKTKTPKDQRPVKEDRGPIDTTGRMVDPKPPTGGRGGRTGGRRSDPRPDRDRGRGGRRGRRRVRDEAFERRRRGGSPRRISREERRRRVRVANTRK